MVDSIFNLIELGLFFARFCLVLLGSVFAWGLLPWKLMGMLDFEETLLTIL